LRHWLNQVSDAQIQNLPHRLMCELNCSLPFLCQESYIDPVLVFDTFFINSFLLVKKEKYFGDAALFTVIR